MKKLIFALLAIVLIVSISFASIREFARGSYRDKNNKNWNNTISYKISGKHEVDKFIIGKRVISIEQSRSNDWIVVVEK
ncbi:MAG: hypothetical protein LBV16_09225 [Elusimicrobiota bacterium]|jgi:hypothetical protein|nr:hypothetical protein [Elusimicrobiota bacterium]